MNSGLEHKPTVLVVDDVPLNIQILAEALKDTCRIKVATGGAKALEVASQAEKPDLILLDVMMPELDGYEVCKRLKASEDTRDIPVIFITAKDSPEDEELGLSLGAVDYIAKPFSLAIVNSRVKTHLRLKFQTDKFNMLSMLDGLTQAANRRAFEATLPREWRRLKRVGGELSVLKLDIDNFKQFNARFGPLKGDDCLKLIAQTVATHFRRSLDLVARYGGDEFVVLLSETNADTAALQAEKLCQAVEALAIPLDEPASGACLTVSVGCATLLPSGLAADAEQTLLELAEEQLQLAQSGGSNQVSCSEVS